MKFRRHLFNVAIALLIVSTFIGCGDGPSDDQVNLSGADQLEMQADQLEMQIIYDAYAEGRLGTPAEVKADMDPFFNDPDRPSEPKPFDGDELVPFDEMSDRQQAFFSEWYQRSEKVSATLGAEILAAKQRLLRELENEGRE